ncbi:MAG: hypothetical protein EBX41_00835 [Chitinophagia bacterium]|nr:hypothetical protein [Chitinophagia bacterium]
MKLKIGTWGWVSIAIVVIIAIVVVINWDNWFNPDVVEKQPDPAGNGSGGVTGNPTGSGLDTDLVLKKGSKGVEVAALQKLLNEVDASEKIAEDGVFGTATRDKLYRLYSITSTSLRHLSLVRTGAQSGFNWNILIPKFIQP